MEYFLKIKYEDGRGHWIKEPIEAAGLMEAEEEADKKVRQLNNQFVSSITGKVVEYSLFRPSFCMRKSAILKKGEKDEVSKKQS